MKTISPETNPILERPVYFSRHEDEVSAFLGDVAAFQKARTTDRSVPPPRLGLSKNDSEMYDLSVVHVLGNDRYHTNLLCSLVQTPENNLGDLYDELTTNHSLYTVAIEKVGRSHRFGQWALNQFGISLGLHEVGIHVSHASGYRANGTVIDIFESLETSP